MNENLVGYALDALDPEGRQEVEAHLAEHPEAQRQLELIRQALEPLDSDREPEDCEPSAGLWVRTLAGVAEYRCRPLPTAPAPLARRSTPVAPAWWRRADVLVAASLFLCVSVLIPPGVSYLRYQRDRTACQENLRKLHTTLTGYSEHNRGDYPRVERDKPVASVLTPLLKDAMGDHSELALTCPANHRLTPRFQSTTPTGSYSYSLGYQDADGFHGLREDDDSHLPILADRPMLPMEGAAEGRDNSPNHKGGQNVLYLGGHVKFWKNRNAGVNGDDIYFNQAGKVAAGLNHFDTVLGTEADRP